MMISLSIKIVIFLQLTSTQEVKIEIFATFGRKHVFTPHARKFANCESWRGTAPVTKN